MVCGKLESFFVYRNITLILMIKHTLEILNVCFHSAVSKMNKFSNHLIKFIYKCTKINCCSLDSLILETGPTWLILVLNYLWRSREGLKDDKNI